jgi:enoyl-[acyl-carrier protein] reductase I
MSPGAIQTRAASGIPNFEQYIKDEIAKTPLHQLVDTGNLGNLAAFISSSAGSDITGQVYYIDAGYSIMD